MNSVQEVYTSFSKTINFMTDVLGGTYKVDNVVPPTEDIFIKVVGAGLPRTGTQTIGYYLSDKFNVYNIMKAVALNHTYLFTKVICEDAEISNSFITWYDTIVSSATHPIATLDVPACFCYQQIVLYQSLMNITNTSILLSLRDAQDWFNSMQALVSTFAPIAGFPYNIWMEDFSLYIADQFARHVHCFVQDITWFGFCVDASIINELECIDGYNDWNSDVERFAQIHDIPLNKIQTTELGSIFSSVTKSELLLIAVLLRVPFMIFLAFFIWLSCELRFHA